MLRKSDAPTDYCIITEGSEHRLSAFERLTLTGGEELERVIARMAKQAQISLDHPIKNLDVNSYKGVRDFYAQANWLKDPQNFFKLPENVPQVREIPFHGLQDGEILDLKFESCYQPVYASYQEEYDRHAENKIVCARMWKHHQAAPASVIAIHGWTMGDQRVNSLAFLPGIFYRLGLDVVLYELPFHGRRKPAAQDGFNDHLFPSANIVRTNESMGQIISDLRELSLYLQQKSQNKVGCVGMSLGAYSGALWAALDKLAFCIPIVPMASMAEMAYQVISKSEEFQTYQDQGLDQELLKDLYHVHCPLSHAPKTEKERMCIVAGMWDSIVPPRQPKLLWDHWNRPRILWVKGGHLAQYATSDVFEEIIRFLSQLGFVSDQSK